MAQIKTKWIEDGAVTSTKLDSTAKQSVLESKLVGNRKGVLTFATTAASSDTVTTEVLAAAHTNTPRSDLVTGEGIYTGTVSGATDAKRVLIREAGTDNGISDDNLDEVYGVLSEAAGVYTLSYKNADGTNFTFGAIDSIDFYFVEISDLHTLPNEALLQNSVSGVVDAGQASTLAGHLDGTANKHDATEVDYERTDGSKKNIQAASDDVESALTDLDDAIGDIAALGTPTNYSTTDETEVAARLDGIDSALASAGGTDFADNVFRVSDNTDATKKIALEASAITTATVRTITMADADVDLADIATNTAHATGDGSDHQDVADLVTLSGVAANSTTLGTFTGTTIADNQTTKAAIQALETAHEVTDGLIDGHLDGGVNKHDASEIDYERVDGSKVDIQAASDDVESAITDLDDNKAGLTRLASTANGDGASLIGIEDSAAQFTATDVEAALAEVKSLVDATPTPQQEIITIAGADVTNQYVDLADTASSAASISITPVSGPLQEQGVDYTVSLAGGAGGVTRITFAGDLATGGNAPLAASDKLIVKYEA